MKYISIDIETSGLDPENNQILSIGAIIEDTTTKLPFDKIPKFHAAIKRENLTGSLFAINMNAKLIETIVQYQTAHDQDEKNDLVQMTGMQFFHEDEIVQEFYYWLYENGIVERDPDFLNQQVVIRNGKTYPSFTMKIKPVHFTPAGKNFGTFDKLFLERLPRWKQCIKMRNRILDPAILFVDWKNDESLPSLGICKERAGLQGVVTHNALEDAWDVIEVLRKKY